MSFLEDIKSKLLVFDGSMGIMLYKNGLTAGTCPEEWNLTHPEIVKSIYKGYLDAGSDVIQTNTFQAHGLKLAEYGIKEKHYDINYQAARLAKEVAGGKAYVAASIGPLGKLLEPFGDLTFEQAYDTFKEQILAVADGGADIISLETFTDVSELRIALLAAKENCSLPVICSVSYEQNGRTLMGSEPGICAVILHSLGAGLIGTNCSFGAEYMIKVAEAYGKTGLPFSIKPNAGLPEIIEGKQVFSETAEGFAKFVPGFIQNGARLLGGCCGTTPEFIAQAAKIIKSSEPVNAPQDLDYITSSTQKIAFAAIKAAEIGRIDVNSDESLREGLLSGDIGAVTDVTMDLLDEDYGVIMIDADIEENGDHRLLAEVVKEAQVYLKQPFIIQSKNAAALEAALRIYKGRAGILAPTAGEFEQLAEKYGAVEVGGFLADGI